jgi:hypothetical protein
MLGVFRSSISMTVHRKNMKHIPLISYTALLVNNSLRRTTHGETNHEAHTIHSIIFTPGSSYDAS